MPMKKSTSLKPDRPLANYAFSDDGKVRLNIQGLPREQDNLELAIGEKFIGAMAQRGHAQFAALDRGSGRADLIGMKPDGERIKIPDTTGLQVLGF